MVLSFVAVFLIRPCVAEEPVRVAAAKPLDLLAKGWGIASGIEFEARAFKPNDVVRQVAGGRFDFALLSDPISPGQQTLLAVKPGSVPQIEAVGWEAVTAIVNASCELGSVQADRLRAVFAESGCPGVGDPVRNWSALFGLEGLDLGEIRAIAPSRENTSFKAVEDNLLRGCGLRPDAEGLPTDAAVERAVASGTDTIGLVARLRDIPNARVLPVVAAGKVDAATPHSVAFSSGAYPFARKIWLVSAKRFYDPDPRARFRSFALSEKGRDEVVRFGFFPLR